VWVMGEAASSCDRGQCSVQRVQPSDQLSVLAAVTAGQVASSSTQALVLHLPLATSTFDLVT